MRTHFIHSNKFSSSSTASSSGGESVLSPRRAPRSGRSRTLLGIAAVGVVVMMTAACSTLPISGSSASGIVASAVQQVGASTSDVSLHMTLNAGSISLTEDGTGGMNVPQGALELNAGTTIFGLTFPGKLELDNGIVYTSVSFPATIITLGKTWLSINLTKLGMSSSDVPAILALIWDLPNLMKMLGSGGNGICYQAADDSSQQYDPVMPIQQLHRNKSEQDDPKDRCLYKRIQSTGQARHRRINARTGHRYRLRSCDYRLHGVWISSEYRSAAVKHRRRRYSPCAGRLFDDLPE